MRGSTFIAFFGISAAISGALIGCGGDDDEEAAAPKVAKVTKSKTGESCLTTNDCDTGLACFSNVCQDEPSGTGGSSTGGSGGKGGSSPLGAEGETCSKHTDCNQGLGCFNSRCATSDTGEGGGNGIGTVGGPGETCQLTSDCDDGLVCIPGGQTVPGIGFTGVCTQTDTGVTPTGKTCGAECLEAADCCELPVEVHALLGANIKSCADLADALATIDCTAANLGAIPAAQCFANDAYCTCTAARVRANWECTAGRCLYHADCTASGAVPGGCAPYSRAGNALTTTCDTVDTDKCQAAAGMPYCTTDASCDTKAVSDDGGDTCNAGECTCFESRCLRKCAETIDCRAGFDCDPTDEVCKPINACSSKIECQRLKGDIRWTCGSNGVCTLPCDNDLDCNPGGFISPLGGGVGPFTMVCAAGECAPIGCANDDECPGATNGVRLFCAPPAAGAGAGAAQSAITD